MDLVRHPMLLLALHIATASLSIAPPPTRPVVVAANPDGGKRKGGHDDEDVR